MPLNTKFWLRISLLNLLIVSVFGALMRYKIGFEFPFLNQKHLQHGHSHFAFTGWITHTLFILMLNVLQRDKPLMDFSRYRKLIIANLFCAYAMLLSFTLQGYGAFSIAFSTLSILVGYLFAFNIFRDSRDLSGQVYTYWFTAALWFNIISSLGTFTLAFMMASHNFNQNIHLASLYFYLHFQYNGFFTFACIGLFLSQLKLSSHQEDENRKLFWMFFISCIPAYLLSVLWAKLPIWLLALVAIAAIVQFTAWIKFMISTAKLLNRSEGIFRSGRYLFSIIAIAVTAKFLLQLGSTIPWVSKLAFGFRPIVIAYLHLILLAIISAFLIAYMYFYKLIEINRLTTAGLTLFVVNIYVNEIILGAQGISSLTYTVIPFVNAVLFVVALFILLGLGLLVISQRGLKKYSLS